MRAPVHLGFFEGAASRRARHAATARDFACLAGLLFTAAIAAATILAEVAS